MANWAIDNISVSGGFLSGLSLQFPTGLICVIGPRGSGKSTLSEAIRLALSGLPNTATKPRLDMIKANLGGAVVTVSTHPDSDRGGFTIRRSYGQTAVITGADSRPVTSIELDRGTFLPLDAYGNQDIESIADESFGSARRNLLDDLCPEEMHQVRLRIADQRRALESNAEAIKAAERRVREITEQIEELGDVQTRLNALPAPTKNEGSPEFRSASAQRQFNDREASAITAITRSIRDLSSDIEAAFKRAKADIPAPIADPQSANADLLGNLETAIADFWRFTDRLGTDVRTEIANTVRAIDGVSGKLKEAHTTQESKYLALQQKNQEAAKAFEARSTAERDVATLTKLKQQQSEAKAQLETLVAARKGLKADYILARDRISELREGVAARLQAEAGSKVRIRVQRNADVLAYQEKLLSALYGSKLKNQEDILRTLSAIRPEDLALIIRDDDFAEFDTHTSFGRERGRKILDALRNNIDPLALDVMPIDDRIIIELDVSTSGPANFKDASELSRGQKCTALLPILLARRSTPLVIDQPEDNLDNHFIYETVVDSILRLKSRRQMIFITHNANIPVLGEADMVVVMNCDGHRAFVQKVGTLDDCRDEIIDLLEGGEEAFELRRQRYEH